MLSFLYVLLIAVLIGCGFLAYIYFKVEGIQNRRKEIECERTRLELKLKYGKYDRQHF